MFPMAKKPTIEQCFAAVEQAISDLEDGELPLEASLSVYESGLKACVRRGRTLMPLQNASRPCANWKKKPLMMR